MPKILAAILAALALSLPALAQDAEDFTGDRPARPTMPTRATQSGGGSGEVKINVRSFGVGGVSRPGDWIGVWLEVSDSSDKVRNVMIRLANPDQDGDTALMQRVIVTNPGATQLVWIYARYPFATLETIDVSAFEAVGSGSDGAVDQVYTPGRMLGNTKYLINGRQTAGTGIGLIGVIGGRAAGLEQYRWVADPSKGDYAVTGHELTEIVPGLAVSSLPDRWQGYASMQALVWTSANTEDNPLNMREQQADAIREYVKRGGHFIVVLPPVGQSWISQPTNPLADIMPAVKVTRNEGVSLDVYRSLITRDVLPDLPAKEIVQTFTPEATSGWNSPEAIPIMTGADNDAVVVRRIVGAGMVTVVGIDVVSARLHLRARTFMAQQFWNRILGKRLVIPTQAEIAAGIKGVKLNGIEPDGYQTNNTHQPIDLGVSSAVNNEGSAATGLLLACIVFISYWLIAGPVGYFILKSRNMTRHAWVGFLAATGIFTAIAWGGANILKPRTVHGRHLTIVTSVYGQPNQTARSWMGLFLPRYGEQELSVASPGTPGSDFKNLIATWDPPSTPSGSSFFNFTDAHGYPMDARKPDTAAFPSRATTKQIQVDWAGALPANWTLPHPIAESNVAVGKEIRLIERPKSEAKPGDLPWKLEGVLTHGLPAPLSNVKIIVCRDPVAEARDDEPYRNLSRHVGLVELPDDWKAGDTLVLDDIFNKRSGSVDAAMETRLAQIVPTRGPSDFGPRDYASKDVPLATAFMDMAKPPAPDEKNLRYFLQRSSTHGLDLSRWLTQPCVIVIGEIGEGRDEVECPIGVRVDGLSGETVRTRVKGRTIIRWIFPLDPDPFTIYALPPPRLPPPGSSGSGNGGAGGSGGGGGETP